ncbi:MAG TPA: GNAT family N-acetyltransferase [Chthoniobacterales bacterium]|nr:GNAT family N-acetyltransferase [Chthoniobacterales bacterium]
MKSQAFNKMVGSYTLVQETEQEPPRLSPRLSLSTSFGSVAVVDQITSEDRPVFESGFRRYALDHRYYEITQSALGNQFEHLYLLLKDATGMTRAVQPFLLVHQDLVMGTPAVVRRSVETARRIFPSFLKLPMIMVGCSAGEGDIACDTVSGEIGWTVDGLKEALPQVGRLLGAWMIVFKDYPKSYRSFLDLMVTGGFTRVPSMPATGMELNFRDFEDYLGTKLSHAMRKNLRRKFRKSAEGPPIEFEVVTDITPYAEEVLPLYQGVYKRAAQKFEELNVSYLSELGKKLPDRSRFLIWRIQGRIVAFASCIVHDGVLRDNYIGLDYSVALDRHLYFVTWRDTVIWAMENGCRYYHSAPLNYDPKLHFRMELEPLDLCVRATNPLFNVILRRLLPILEPTRYDPVLKKFSNANELW